MVIECAQSLPYGFRRILQAPPGIAAVKGIADNGVSPGRHMPPTLMLPPRRQPAFHQAGLGAGGLQYPVPGQGRLAAFFDHRHFLAVGGVAPDGPCHLSLPRPGIPPNQCLVGACQLAFLQLTGQVPVREIVLGHHYQAAAPLVQPVHAAGTVDPAEPRTAVRAKTTYGTEQNCAIVGSLRSGAAELEISVPQLVLAWTLAKPQITSVIVGSSRPEQVASNAEAVDVNLPDELLDRLNAL